MATPDDDTERYDARTRKPDAPQRVGTTESLARVLRRLWDDGGRDGVVEVLSGLSPARAAALAARLAVGLHEENVLDAADLIEHLERAC